jgi:hypothetical protein
VELVTLDDFFRDYLAHHHRAAPERSDALPAGAWTDEERRVFKAATRRLCRL